MRKGILFVLSGPSGAGKGTVLKKVFKKVKNLKYSISATTRKARADEKHGVNYFFKTDEEFDKMIEDNELLEYVAKYGNRYGTIKNYIEEVLNSGKDIILEIETCGAENIRKTDFDQVSIFLTPSSVYELVSRLKDRNTESIEWQCNRIKTGKQEIECAYSYDYIVINDNLSQAIDEIISIIIAERLKVERNKETINNIINN